MGSVYRRPGSRFWWIRYSVNGKRIGESSKSETWKDAVDLLQRRLADRDRRAGIRPASLVDVLDDYIKDSELRGVRAPHVLKKGAREAVAFFGDCNVISIRTRNVREYQRHLVDKQGLANATVNGRMSVLASALRLAAQNEYLDVLPYFPRLKPGPPRQGFLERADFDAIRKELPDWGVDVFEFAYFTGWRRNEVLWLTWEEVDWENKVIILARQRSKNGEPRVFPVQFFVSPIMSRRVNARRLGLPYVFHRDGRKIGLTGWRGVWKGACKRASRPNTLLHEANAGKIPVLARRLAVPAQARREAERPSRTQPTGLMLRPRT